MSFNQQQAIVKQNNSNKIASNITYQIFKIYHGFQYKLGMIFISKSIRNQNQLILNTQLIKPKLMIAISRKLMISLEKNKLSFINTQ
jgi:hypothetical protein